MTQPGFELDPDALRAHARMVDEAAAMCGEATSGAEYLDLHDGVYGEWPGKLFVPLINPAQDWALRELRQATDAIGHLADLIRTVVAEAETADSEVARRFRGGT